MITEGIVVEFAFFSVLFFLFLKNWSNGLLNLPIPIQLATWKPFLLWKVFSLWTAYHVSGCKPSEYQCRLCKDLFSPVNRNIPTRGGIFGSGWGSGLRKQMLVLEQCQLLQKTKDPDGAHEQRARNVCFSEVSFKWRESYKKHTSRTESKRQSQRPVRQAHMQHHLFLES